MRCFVALELPPEVQAAAGEVLRELKASGADVKWVRPENLHVTLKFLGEADEGLVPALKDGLQRACTGRSALDLALAGVGAFPSPQRPQVVWLGLAGDTEALAGLAGALETEMAPLGFAPEGRPFKAHLTLGRVRRGKGGGRNASTAPLTRALAALAGWCGPAFEAGRVVLMKSTLTPQGSIYDPVQVVTLV